jgi:beta-1,4-mannooligosaccharide phosphorylase
MASPGSSGTRLDDAACVRRPAGWLAFTHGVGPMREYAIGAILLDLDEPEHLISALPEPLLVADESERDGYVPNVVYSCGSLLHGGTVVLPTDAAIPRCGSRSGLGERRGCRGDRCRPGEPAGGVEVAQCLGVRLEQGGLAVSNAAFGAERGDQRLGPAQAGARH